MEPEEKQEGEGKSVSQGNGNAAYPGNGGSMQLATGIRVIKDSKAMEEIPNNRGKDYR
jgi:hypothetical protein